MHYKEITEAAIAKNLLSHVGKTPEVTMSHRLTAAIKKDDKEVPIVKLKPGVFALREWEGKKGKRGSAAPAREAAAEPEAEANEDGTADVNALEIEAALRGAEERAAAPEPPDAEDRETGDSNTPVSGEEALRADLAASGAEFFDDEDDDDQPILAPLSQPGGVAATGPLAAGEGGRRRRRRRRRGRGGAPGDAAGEPRFSGPRPDGSQPRLDGQMARPHFSPSNESGPIQPTPIVSIDGDSSVEAREALAPARPVVRDRQQIMAGGQAFTGIDIRLGRG